MARGRGKGPSPQDRMRRAFARRQRARRWLTWRFVLAAVLLVGGLCFGIYAIYFSSWLRADAVQVVGNAQLSEKQVLATADVPLGGPLATVDVHAIEVRLKSLATVKSVDVSRTWPHDVRIEIVERTPVAVVELGGRLRGLDADGVVFREYKKAPPGMPRVRPGSSAGTDALKEAATVVSALPEDLAARVDHVEVETVDQITLALRDGRQVLWGSAEESALKAEVVDKLLAAQKAPFYDVSVPGNPTYRTAAP